jgi:hypothetical protein
LRSKYWLMFSERYVDLCFKVLPLTSAALALEEELVEEDVMVDSVERPSRQQGCRLVTTLRSHDYSAFIWSIQSDGFRKGGLLCPVSFTRPLDVHLLRGMRHTSTALFFYGSILLRSV